jgi:hypothetical protein
MNGTLPHLDVHGPQGEHFAIELAGARVAVGRSPELNGVALEPDPQQWVGRREHFLVEHASGAWWVVDNGSVNGTFLRRGDGPLERVHGRTPLLDGDVICVLGLLPEDGGARYWELRFRDPFATHRAPLPAAPRSPCLAYDPLEARLFLVDGGERRPVRLSPQEHRLVRHMARRNAANGNVPVLCSHEELLAAVWEDEPLHSQVELNRLVWGLRRRLDGGTAGALIENERALGYRLHSCA